MTILSVRSIPDPVLRQKAKPVAKVDERIVKLMHDMLETMYHANGIGLAANQVGLLDRVIVIDLSEERDGSKAVMMANPEIVWSAKENQFTYKEGCLSVPEQYAEVTRPARVRITYLDQNGKKQELEAEELLSTCIQHEIDHLNGIVFIDHLSKLKRDMIVKKIDKARREGDGHLL